MATHQFDDTDLAAQYTESVACEKEAWQALQAHQPGTPERARAWEAWSAAIMQTNQAWRRLNARRFADPSRRLAPQQGARHASA
jgi:hypothetical protein